MYAQTSESDSERAVVGASSVSPKVTSTGSRLIVMVKGLQAGESAWVDEVLLEDSLGSAALLFQGQAAYKPKDLELGPKSFPTLSGISLSGDAEGALDSTPYASAAADLGTTLLFARLDLRARVSGSSASGSGFSGGHTIELPASSFPVKVKDSFDLDPLSGAFGRADSLTASAGPIAALSLDQSSAWTPADSSLDQGMLNQTWDGTLTLGPSIATFGLTASNRSMPSGLALPGGEGAGYAAAWIGAFEYALPEYEADAVSRQSQATVSIKDAGSREYLSASMGESTSPSSYGTGTRQDTASARLALPLSFGKLQVEPYYSRAWTDSRRRLLRRPSVRRGRRVGRFQGYPRPLRVRALQGAVLALDRLGLRLADGRLRQPALARRAWRRPSASTCRATSARGGTISSRPRPGRYPTAGPCRGPRTR